MKQYIWIALVLPVVIVLFTSNADAQPTRKTVINRTASVNGKPARANRVVVINRQPARRATVKTIRRQRAINVLPGKAIVMTHRNVPYYYISGTYYRKSGAGYVVAPAPIGLRVRSLPAGYCKVVVGPVAIFHFGGTFYKQLNDNEYEVIAPPNGGIVYDLPDDAQEITVDGKVYYEYNGTLYKKVETESGWAYEVAGVINDN